MTDQATAPAPQAPSTPIASIKAFLNSQPNGAAAAEREAAEAPEPTETSGVAPAHSEAPESAPDPEEAATREDAEETEVESPDETAEDDAQDVEVQLSTIDELAEATGLDKDKLLDLSLPTKIDGKEGTARIRDLLKSYQLDGHINQKLAALDTDRKTLETKRAEQEKAATERITVLENGIGVLSQSLEGEFAAVNWDALQKNDPAKYNALYVSYQQRFAQMQQIAQQIEAGKAQQKAYFEAQAKAWTEEQDTLRKAKLPEWEKDRPAVAEYLKGVGISQEEFDQLQDHRYAVVVSDARKWAELQKQRPATLKKVKAAPKLLKPGSKQSRESRDVIARKENQARLRTSGKVGDAARVIKGILGARK
jgi:hypothetical protein